MDFYKKIVFMFFAVFTLTALTLTIMPVFADGAKWQKEQIFVYVKSDKTVPIDKTDLVKSYIETNGYGRIRDSGKVYYKDWDSVLKYTGIKLHINLTDNEQKADVIVKLTVKTKYNKSNILVGGETDKISSYIAIKKANVVLYDVNGFNDAEVTAILNHELGHVLGLNHIEDCTCIMQPSSLQTEYILQPDVNSLIDLYLK